jgi:hypothetical protein
MNMPEPWYQDKLYPLQDRVLTALRGFSASMYLTGGTALSREYLHHRYSDDLDFFWNDDADFAKEAEGIVGILRAQGFDRVEIGLTTPAFVRVTVSRRDVDLKIDLVNDVPVRTGVVVEGNVFPRVDTVLNILTNKLTALPRQEAKDVADIISISRSRAFNWMEMVAEARRKDMWVDELDISGLLAGFDPHSLTKVKWIQPPDYDILARDLRQLAKDLGRGVENSLFRASQLPPLS